MYSNSSSPTRQSTFTPYQAPQYVCYNFFLFTTLHRLVQTYIRILRNTILSNSLNRIQSNFFNLSSLFCLLLTLFLFLLLLLVFAVFVSFSVTRGTEPIDFTRVIYYANAGPTANINKIHYQWTYPPNPRN